MLSRAELDRIAPTLTNGNIGHAEKLYLQDIILSTVSRETVDELVFKGGTALMKFYQLDRFSEDLDFTARSAVSVSSLVDSAVRDLENYGATVDERTDEETATAQHARLGIQGPLYTGDRRSLSFVRIQANTRSSISDVQTLRYTPQFPDLASFDLAVLSEPEILAEKIRALLTRQQPRDLYDCYHLIERGTAVDTAVIQDKLDYYDITYDPVEVIDEASGLESRWETLDALTYSSLPRFSEAMDALEGALLDASPTHE